MADQPLASPRGDHLGAARRRRLEAIRVGRPGIPSDREEEAPATQWERPSTASEPRAAGASFGLGDDVVHANFGDGVVTGMEPGGLVVVRFASARSETTRVAANPPPYKR